ncbi:MAG: hypothetical protein K5907_09560 [Treponema sp.]|nr:hypothetical protein [Treponema sp.]
MKLTKYIKAAAALLVAATALAGCKFEGTKTDFKDYEYNAYAVTYDEVEKPAEIADYTTTIQKAEAKTAIDFSIVSRGYLDEKSIDAAVNAYILEDATADNLPFAKGAVLTKTLRRVVKNEYTGTGSSICPVSGWNATPCVVTTAYYYIDASSVTKSAIALVVDATKLKEKTGKLVLNTNGNEKCGEESDSVIAIVDVDAKSNGASTEYFTKGHANEDYAPTFYLDSTGLWDWDPADLETNTEGKHTGVIKYTVDAPFTWDADGERVYADSFAADLGNMYTFLSLPIGAKEWKKDSLTWTYNSTTHVYEANSPAIEYGTQYRLLVKENNSLEFPAMSTFYGHTAKISWKKDTSYWGYASTYNYATTEPEYIYNLPDNNESITTPTAWSETTISITDSTNGFASNQDNVIAWEKYNGNKVIFKIADTYASDTYNLRFGTTDGFIITDAKGNIIKTKTPVVYDEDTKGVKAVMIEVDNAYTNLASGFTFWVGEKTTLKANAKYPAQLKFGCPAIATTYGPAGYVKLAN